MFNFTLANFFSGYRINLIFMDLISKHKDCLKFPIHFNQISGSFPFNTWNGDLNSCLDGNILRYDEIDKCFNSYNQSIRLNFSNIFLKKEDFFNSYNKVILEKVQNGSTAIELSNLQLYYYIKENYPYYNKFILSPNAWEIIDLNPKEINKIMSNSDFQLVSLPFKVANDFNYINQIENKNKIEICVNPWCPSYCRHYSKCIAEECLNQYDFSEKSVFADCPKTYVYSNNPQVLSLEDLEKKYIRKGINHFKIASCPNHRIIQYFSFLVKYFIKDEYQNQFFEKGLFLITNN